MTEPMRFAKELERLGLTVVQKKRGNGFVVLSPQGEHLGAFGANINRHSTRRNICAQIKRATGIEVK